VGDHQATAADLPATFLTFCDDALGEVYAYVSARVRLSSVAEDLTSEIFLVAVDAVRRDNPPNISLPWIIGVARHKLVDHWRRLGRETSGLRALEDQYTTSTDDEWSEAHLDAVQARETLESLAPHHQAVLSLRYLDDLPVADVAALLGRTVHATEALLMRAKAAFRRAYEDQDENENEGIADDSGEETSDV
jgi:RNA polymerase sigma-70 factor (ECF subfamily)